MMEDVLFVVEEGTLHDIVPRQCGREACERGHFFGPAIRDHYLIHYILSGRGTFTSHGQTYPLSAGHLFLIRPGEITTYRADKADPWTYIWVGLDGILSDSMLADIADVSYQPQLEYLFREMLLPQADLYAQGYFLCGKIFELLARLGKAASLPAPAAYAQRAQNYIQSHYIHPITVGGIAQLLGIDRRYLSEVCKRYLGKSPKQYLTELRMGRAKELLAGGGLTVAEVARNVGYDDVFQFSKLFKRYHGLPPSAFR